MTEARKRVLLLPLLYERAKKTEFACGTDHRLEGEEHPRRSHPPLAGMTAVYLKDRRGDILVWFLFPGLHIRLAGLIASIVLQRRTCRTRHANRTPSLRYEDVVIGVQRSSR